VRSNQIALVYLREIRAWLDAHPQELLVIEISKHGSECAKGNDQYPFVSIALKQAFWDQIAQVFGGLLVEKGSHPLNTTSIAELLRANMRVALFTADWVEFTGSSPLAHDLCAQTQWQSPPGADNEVAAPAWEASYYASAKQRRAEGKAAGVLHILGLQDATAGWLVEAFAKLYFDPFAKDANARACASQFKIPNMTAFCPGPLQDLVKLNNYYKSQLLAKVPETAEWDFPNVVAVDDVGQNGTMLVDSAAGTDGAVRRVALVDTAILATLRRLCTVTPAAEQAAAASRGDIGAGGASYESSCEALTALVEARRARFPSQRWDDRDHGRLTDWPSA
jgi:hypothetical protein